MIGKAAGRADSRLAVALVAFVGVTVLIYREAVLGILLGGLAEWTAEATALALGWLGIDALREATVVYQAGGFAYEIYYRCTGFLPAAFLTTVILASPVGGRRKLIGLALGIPLLGVLNLVRLVHLFVLGTSRPELFDLAHGVVWEGAMVLAVFGLWWVWMRWADADRERASGDAAAPAAEERRQHAQDPSLLHRAGGVRRDRLCRGAAAG